MSEWYDSQKKPSGNFRQLLQKRIEKTNPRRELTVYDAAVGSTGFFTRGDVVLNNFNTTHLTLSDLFGSLLEAIWNFIGLVICTSIFVTLCTYLPQEINSNLLRIILFFLILLSGLGTVLLFFKPTIIASNINVDWEGYGLWRWLVKNKIANLIQLYTCRLAWPFWAILIFPLVILRLMDWDYLEFPPNDLVTDTLWKRDYPEYIESHPHFFFIFIVNLLLGATGIFWIITYIWALLGCKRFDRRLCSVEIDEKGTTITLHMRYKLANSSPSPNDFEIIVYEHHGHTWWRNIIDVNVSGHTIEIIVEDPIPAGTDVSVRYWQEFYGGPIMEDMGDKLIGFWSEDKQTINNSTIIKSIFETSDHTKNNGEI